jgi:hypothetical protein
MSADALLICAVFAIAFGAGWSFGSVLECVVTW